jgi:hypothetical protein
MFIDASCDEVEIVVGIEVGIDVCETVGMLVDASCDEAETVVGIGVVSMFLKQLECLLMHLVMKQK